MNIFDQKETGVLAITEIYDLRKYIDKETVIQVAKQTDKSEFTIIFDACEDCEWYELAKTYCRED